MLSKEEYLDNLLKGIAEQEQASDLILEESEPEVVSDLILEDAPTAELPLEEPEIEPSIEPESDMVLDADSDADLAALLEAVPETDMEEGIGLPLEGSMPELSSEPDLDAGSGADSDADLEALLESVPEMDLEEGIGLPLEESMPELPLEEEPESADNLDVFTDIGDDIEARLDMAAELPPVTEEFPEDDVMSMLEESDDSDLQEIQELLRKSDSNEAVDDSVEDLLNELPEEDLEAKIIGDSEESAEETPAERRRKAKEEKAREKAKKKAEAAARKAARKAEKEAAKREKAAAGRGQTQDKEEEQAFDPAVLDSIVSEAGMAGGVRQDEELPANILGDMTEGGEEEPFNPLAEADEIPESPQPTEEVETEEPDGLGVDFDNLFGSEEALMGEESGGLSELRDGRAVSDDQEKVEEKKGIFSRLIHFLTEEDEEEEENENIKLSQENQDILNELDKEKGKKKKGKKGKKGKDSAEDDEASGKGAKGKKAAKPKKESKPKKPPKPKKQKPPRETPLIPERKLTFKRMFPVLLVGVSVGVLLFVFVNATVDFTDKKTARDAFYAGDYQTCYQNLFGKELDETESIMYGKSKSILYIRLWIREYQMFAEEGDRIRGLDSLIQTVAAYPGLYEYARLWNAEEEVAAGYATILNLLKSEYGLSESQALEISRIWRDVDYTRAVIAAAGGNFDSKAPDKDQTGSGNDQGEIVNSGESQLPDFLSEEEGLGEENFHDNR